MRWNLTTAAAVIAIACAQQANAQSISRYQFDIPAGTRAEVIQSIGRTAGSRVSFSDKRDQALGEPIGPIRGNFTLPEALSRALEGSEWYVETTSDNQVRIARNGSGSDILVTGQRQSLRREDSSLLTRTDTPLKDTPGTVVSVTQAVLASQNVTSLNEATRNLPGVSFIPGPPGQIGARGDTTRGASFTNGLRNSSLGSEPPTFDVEAIEVLKGPSSILTGTAVAGGLVNLVPKLATGTSQNTFDFGVGSNTYVRADADVGGTISEEHRLFWRAIGLAEYAERTSKGGREPHSYVGGLIFGYRDNGWKVDAQTQYFDTRTTYGNMFANDEATQSIVPIDFVPVDTSYFSTRSFSQNLSIEKDLVTSETLSLRLRSRSRYQRVTQDAALLSYAGKLDLGDEDGVVDLVTAAVTRSRSKQFSTSNDIYAKVVTGSLQQQLIVAFDYTQDRTRSLLNGFDVLYPLEPVPEKLTIPTENTPNVFRIGGLRKDYGVVIQDQITWGRIHALASVRHSWFDYDSPPIAEGFDPIRQRVRKWLPTGGLVFSATKWASIYYSYQKGLTPPQPSAALANGEAFPPSVTTGHEVGAKLELFNNKLSLNADYFWKSSNNLNLPDPINPGFSIVGPGQKTRGFELSMVGKITPTLFVQSGFTYLENAGDIAVVGAPKYNANAWILKSFNVSEGQKIDLGFGGNYQSEINLAAIDPDTGISTYPRFYGDDYLRFDGSIGYSSGPYKVNLAVNNIFDKKNIYTPLIDTSLYQGVGREFRLVFTVALPGTK